MEQSTNLTEEDGVVATRSFQLLVQWLYLGRVILDELAPEEAITATIEFVRIADMYKVTGMESLMADRIKSILKAKPPSKTISTTRASDTNTYCLTSQHIISAALLPGGHPVRMVLTSAARRSLHFTALCALSDLHKVAFRAGFCYPPSYVFP
jgi:hypothetical protein